MYYLSEIIFFFFLLATFQLIYKTSHELKSHRFESWYLEDALCLMILVTHTHNVVGSCQK
jgi:hypothetical protein